MFHEGMAAAIVAARTLSSMDDLARRLWQGHASGALDDEAAQKLAEQLHERRKIVRGGITPVGIPPGRNSLFPPRRPQRSPDRSLSLYRRRQLAASGPMPPALASRFTTGQLAVLRIVGDEFIRTGTCALCVDAIAARAGVCRRLAQAAIRLAEGDGLLTIQERRREGAKNLPNVVRIISREWLLWLKRGDKAARVQKNASHGYSSYNSGKIGENEASQSPPEGGARPRRQRSAGLDSDGRERRAMRGGHGTS